MTHVQANHAQNPQARNHRRAEAHPARGLRAGHAGGARPLRVRWVDGLYTAPAGGGAARDGRAGVQRAGRAGGGARRRHGAVRRCAAARRRRAAVAGQVQPADRHRPGQPHGPRGARRAQPRHQRGGGALRALLRAGPVQPDRLHHRRQRRGELGRRALPQVRAHGAQHRGSQARHHRWRAVRGGQCGTGRAGCSRSSWRSR